MAGFGRRTPVNRRVDLTNGGQFDARRPGPRAVASDIKLEPDHRAPGKAAKPSGGSVDEAGSGAPFVTVLQYTGTAMIPPLVTLLICLTAGVRGSSAVSTCLVVLVTSCGVAGTVLYGVRRARRHRKAQAERAREDQPVVALTLKNKRKATHSARRRTKGGKGGGKSSRGRRS